MCVHFSQKYTRVFLCSDELNHSPTTQKERERERERERRKMDIIRFATAAHAGNWMEREMSWQQWGWSVLSGTGVCVCVCVCACVATTTWDQLHIKKCPVGSLTMRAQAGWEEICIAMRQRERWGDRRTYHAVCFDQTLFNLLWIFSPSLCLSPRVLDTLYVTLLRSSDLPCLVARD